MSRRNAAFIQGERGQLTSLHFTIAFATEEATETGDQTDRVNPIITE